MEKFNKELLGVGAGLAAVETGPDAVKGVFEELSGATGSQVEFFGSDLPEGLEHFVEAGIEGAQTIALPVATILLMYYGLKHMVQAGKEN